jgi:hypothetical protein
VLCSAADGRGDIGEGDTVGGGTFARRSVVAAGGGVLVDEGVFAAAEVSLAVVGGIVCGDFVREVLVRDRASAFRCHK